MKATKSDEDPVVEPQIEIVSPILVLDKSMTHDQKEGKLVDTDAIKSPEKRLNTVSDDAATEWASPDKHGNLGDAVTENTVVLPDLSHHIQDGNNSSQAKIMLTSFMNRDGSKHDVIGNLTHELSR